MSNLARFVVLVWITFDASTDAPREYFRAYAVTPPWWVSVHVLAVPTFQVAKGGHGSSVRGYFTPTRCKFKRPHPRGRAPCRVFTPFPCNH